MIRRALFAVTASLLLTGTGMASAQAAAPTTHGTVAGAHTVVPDCIPGLCFHN